MSQALYRRYRPETFGDVIGQEHVTEPLQQALRTGRVNHAYLFSGPRGCGKTTSARILARCLNCEQGPTDSPCGECDSCVALARGGAGTVDVIEIDAASHGGVDDARELRERASYGPAQSRYKVYIIDEAHMVTTQGFNALLKIVEEPPEHVKFVFATTEPEKVIGTIRSRTHHYPFRLVPPAQLHDYLASVCESEGVAVEPGVLSFVVRAGGGSVRDSLSVLDQLIAGSGPDGLTYEGAAALLGFTDAELLDATVTAIGHRDAAVAFAEVDRVIETGLDPRRFVEDLLERLRDLIICAAMPDGAAAVLRGVPADQLDRMHVQAAAFGPGGLSRAADVVSAGLAEMTGATAPRLQLELLIARLLLPGAAGPQGYAARLDRIERRLDMGVRAPEEHAPVPGGSAPAAPPGPSDPAPAPAPAAASGGGSSPDAPPAARPVSRPAVQPPEPSPAAADSSSQQRRGQPAAPPPDQPARTTPTPGGIDQAAVVRAWPDILDWLSRHKKVAWTLISAHSQPVAFDGSRLVLAFSTVGLAENFRRGDSATFVQKALLEVLGVDARIEGVVADDARDGGRAGPPTAGAAPITTPSAVRGPAPARSGTDRAESASERSEAPDGSGAMDGPGPKGAAESAARAPSEPPDFMPSRHAVAAPGQDWSSAPPPASSAPTWATGGDAPGSSAPASAPESEPAAKSAPASTPAAASVPATASDPAAESNPAPTAGTPLAPVVPIRPDGRTPAPTVVPPAAPAAELVDDPDAMSDDDEDIEASGEVGLAVVERLLGGTVISEDDD